MKIHSFKTFMLENNNYREIEFVCHNSEMEDSTDKKSQLNLYKDLKKLEIESNYGIKPYMQDFSDDNNTQKSLAVIILDKSNQKELEKSIFNLADKNGVEFDLHNDVSGNFVNSIIRGDYDNLI